MVALRNIKQSLRGKCLYSTKIGLQCNFYEAVVRKNLDFKENYNYD